MKIQHFILIGITILLLATAGLYLTPQALSPEEAKKARQNRIEILRSQLQKELPADSVIPDSVIELQIPMQ